MVEIFGAPAYNSKKFQGKFEFINQYYRDEGYRDFTILGDSVYYEPKKRGLVVKIKIDEGEKYKFRNFTWEGHSLYETEIFENTLNLQSGDDLVSQVLMKQSIKMYKVYIWIEVII
ncbi:MAG: hypothetical protein CM1200mP33_5210 [Chloroflexota bacterium]|nr:MAG: hypothetical protein CM1200mP33_5210 [Chloroflexota bacterium]